MHYNFGLGQTKTGIFPRYNDDDGEMHLAGVCCVEPPVNRAFLSGETVMRCTGCGKQLCVEADEMSSYTERFNLSDNPGITAPDIADWAAAWMGVDRDDVEVLVTIT